MISLTNASTLLLLVALAALCASPVVSAESQNDNNLRMEKRRLDTREGHQDGSRRGRHRGSAYWRYRSSLAASSTDVSSAVVTDIVSTSVDAAAPTETESGSSPTATSSAESVTSTTLDTSVTSTSTETEIEATPTSTSSTAEAAASTASSSGSSSGGDVKSGGQATYYTQGGVAGACGTVNPDSASIVALPPKWYASGSNCGKEVTITAPSTGQTISATVADLCPSCVGDNSMDLSIGAISALAGSTDYTQEGVYAIEWSFQ